MGVVSGFVPQSASTVAVSTTVLECGGASNWTQANAKASTDTRYARITNLDASNDLYVAAWPVGTAAPTQSALIASAEDIVPPKGSSEYMVQPGWTLLCVRSSGSGGATYRENLA